VIAMMRAEGMSLQAIAAKSVFGYGKIQQ